MTFKPINLSANTLPLPGQSQILALCRSILAVLTGAISTQPGYRVFSLRQDALQMNLPWGETDIESIVATC